MERLLLCRFGIPLVRSDISLGTAFYRGADCAFLIYDITNSWSFDNIPKWKKTFLDRSMVSQPDNFPFMLIGNKNDLEEEGRVVSKI